MNKAIRSSGGDSHSRIKNIIRVFFLALSILFGSACIIGYDTQNRGNVLIIFFCFSLIPFSFCMISFFKSLVRRVKSKKKASGTDVQKQLEKKENGLSPVIPEIPQISPDIEIEPAPVPESTEIIRKKYGAVEEPEEDTYEGPVSVKHTSVEEIFEEESSGCIEVINTDEGEKAEAAEAEESGIQWDREKVGRYMRTNPEFRYDEPFGRIFLGTRWFVDGSEKDETVIGYYREIEKRGGRINSVVGSSVTHYLPTASRDASGFGLHMAEKYGTVVMTEDAFRDIVSIAECTSTKNRWMFTPSKLFRINRVALNMLEQEDRHKYLFLAPYGEDGLVMTSLRDREEKETVIWNGTETEEFWCRYGEKFRNYILVAADGKNGVLKRLGRKLAEAGIENQSFTYIEMAFFCGATTRHERKEDICDIKYMSRYFGFTPPEDESEMSDALCAVFMTYIIDHNKPPLEYLSFYRADTV